MNRWLKPFSILTAVFMYMAVQMGALVTNTGSADGCGAHWPLCKGTFMPEWDYEAMIEFSHRAVSGAAGIFSVVLAIWVWRTLPHRPLIRWLAVGGMLFTGLQGSLGAMAVMWPQPKAVLALHFGISVMCFALVLLVTTSLFREEQGAAVATGAPVHPLFRRWVWTVAGFSYVVIYMGAYVRHVRASASCIGWPLCNGQLVPALYGPVGAAFIHRVGAALLTIMVIRMAFMVRNYAPERADLRRAADLAAGLIVLQVLGGALFGLGFINLLTQMTHTATISLFWGALAYLALTVSPTPAVDRNVALAVR